MEDNVSTEDKSDYLHSSDDENNVSTTLDNLSDDSYSTQDTNSYASLDLSARSDSSSTNGDTFKSDRIQCRDVIVKSKMATERTFSLQPFNDKIRRFEVQFIGQSEIYVTLHPAKDSVLAGGLIRFSLTVQLHCHSLLTRTLTLTRESEVWGELEVITLRLANNKQALSLLPELGPSDRRDLIQSKLDSIREDVSQHQSMLQNNIGNIEHMLQYLHGKSETLYHLGLYDKSLDLALFVYNLQVKLQLVPFKTLIQMYSVIETMKKSNLWNLYLKICKETLKNDDIINKEKIDFIKAIAETLENNKKYEDGINLFSELHSEINSHYGFYHPLSLRLIIITLTFIMYKNLFVKGSAFQLYLLAYRTALAFTNKHHHLAVKLLDLGAFLLIFQNPKHIIKTLQYLPKFFKLKDSDLIYKHTLYHQAFCMINLELEDDVMSVLNQALFLSIKHGTKSDIITQKVLRLKALKFNQIGKLMEAKSLLSSAYVTIVSSDLKDDSFTMLVLAAYGRVSCELGLIDDAWGAYLKICSQLGVPPKSKTENRHVLLEYINQVTKSNNPLTMFVNL